VSAAATALGWAIDRLDSEEHRYVERFGDCPNGCRFEPTPGGHGLKFHRVAGPADCDVCDEGTVEDENAPWIDADLEALRGLAGRLEPTSDVADIAGVVAGRYREGEINHILQPIIGWLRLDLADGKPVTDDATRRVITRMYAACGSERALLAAAEPSVLGQVLRDHTYQLGPARGQICLCGFGIPMERSARSMADRDDDATLQDTHEAHLAVALHNHLLGKEGA
jgi:hypothetical protein